MNGKMNEKTEVSFSEGAERVINESLSLFKKSLTNMAIDLALRERGEPVEITASDIKKARDVLYGKKTRTGAQMRELILRTYFIVGIALGITGVIVPYFRRIRRIFEVGAPEVQVGLLIAVLGFGLAAVSGIILRFRKFTGYLTKREKKQQ